MLVLNFVYFLQKDFFLWKEKNNTYAVITWNKGGWPCVSKGKHITLQTNDRHFEHVKRLTVYFSSRLLRNRYFILIQNIIPCIKNEEEFWNNYSTHHVVLFLSDSKHLTVCFITKKLALIPMHLQIMQLSEMLHYNYLQYSIQMYMYFHITNICQSKIAMPLNFSR